MVFEELYETYWNKVFRLSMGYVNNHDLAKDIAQETFIKVWEQLPKFRNESGIGTWIFRIASNECLRQVEKEKRMPKGEMTIHPEDKPDESIETKVSFLHQKPK
jgi:RNA polymerase sigma-70 factor (ECF subfamily)